MNNQTCPWRFGEPAEVTDFITPNNIGIREAADALIVCKADGSMDADATIEADAAWIIPFKYPLDSKGNPCASGRQQRHQLSFGRWMRSKFVYYMWSYPSEVLNSQLGICIDTANLLTSVMRRQGLEARTVLGEIRRAREIELVGYHAWTETIYRGEPSTLETTVEDPGQNIIFPVSLTCDRKSAWAQEKDLYYKRQTSYAENICEDVPGATVPSSIMLQLIGLPVSMVEKHGLSGALSMAGVACEMILNPCRPNLNKLGRLWGKEEMKAKTALREAYCG